MKIKAIIQEWLDSDKSESEYINDFNIVTTKAELIKLLKAQSPPNEVAKHLEELILSDEEIETIALGKYPIRSYLIGSGATLREHDENLQDRTKFREGFKGAIGMIEMAKKAATS